MRGLGSPAAPRSLSVCAWHRTAGPGPLGVLWALSHRYCSPALPLPLPLGSRPSLGFGLNPRLRVWAGGTAGSRCWVALSRCRLAPWGQDGVAPSLPSPPGGVCATPLVEPRIFAPVPCGVGALGPGWGRIEVQRGAVPLPVVLSNPKNSPRSIFKGRQSLLPALLWGN